MQLALAQPTQCLVLNAKNLEIQSVRLSRQEVDTEEIRQDEKEDIMQDVKEDGRQDIKEEGEAGGSGLVKDPGGDDRVGSVAPRKGTRRRPGPASRTKASNIEEKVSPVKVIGSDSDGEVVKDTGVESSDELKDSIKSGRKSKRRSCKDEDSKPLKVIKSDSEVEVTQDSDGADCSEVLQDSSKAVRKSTRKSFKDEEFRPVKVIKSDSEDEVVEVDSDEDMAQVDGCDSVLEEDMAQVDGCDSVLEEDWSLVTTSQLEVAVSRCEEVEQEVVEQK